VFLVAAVVVLPSLLTDRFANACPQADATGTPFGITLVALVVLAGASLLVGLPRASAVAPAVALGASLPLLGGAAAGWVWLAEAPCFGNVLDGPGVFLVLQTAGALAVVGTATWLLYSRDEIEPWYGSHGVVLATSAALTLLVLGLGFAVLFAGPAASSIVIAALTGPVPWAVAVGAVAWLRRSPAVAIVIGSLGQALWLLIASS